MNFKNMIRIFLILIIILSVIISLIPAANHYDKSFEISTHNNIIDKYNNTTYYINKNNYASAFLRTYGGDLTITPGQIAQTISPNCTVYNYISIYHINLKYHNIKGTKIFGEIINNTVNIKLSSGYYIIKYNSTIIINGKQNIDKIKNFNLLVVTPPDDFSLIIIACIMAIPAGIVGIASGIVYYRDKSKH